MALFLSANIHQGDELFSVQSRGKQCAFMSLSAVLTAQNISLIDWSTTFNIVLLQGDKMYLKALNNGLIDLVPGVKFLSVDNLPKVVSDSCCTYTSMLSYDIVEPLSMVNTPAESIQVEPIEAKSMNDLLIVVEPIEAKNIDDPPIVVEPIEGKSNIDLPVAEKTINVQHRDAEMRNQMWFINYGKELQGLVITDGDIESHYYDIHTALLNTFLNHSFAMLILEGYMMGLIKQANVFNLFDSHACLVKTKVFTRN